MRRNWPREGRQPVRDAGGFGLRPNPPASLTGWRPSRGQLRRIRQFRLYERTYPPEGGERRSPIYIRGSFARTRINFYTVTKFLYKGIAPPLYPRGGGIDDVFVYSRT